MSFKPSSGRNFRRMAWVRKHTHFTWALASFKVKYRWPDCAGRKFETSPSTHKFENCEVSTPPMRAVSSATLQTFRSGARFNSNCLTFSAIPPATELKSRQRLEEYT